MKKYVYNVSDDSYMCVYVCIYLASIVCVRERIT